MKKNTEIKIKIYIDIPNFVDEINNILADGTAADIMSVENDRKRMEIYADDGNLLLYTCEKYDNDWETTDEENITYKLIDYKDDYTNVLDFINSLFYCVI